MLPKDFTPDVVDDPTRLDPAGPAPPAQAEIPASADSQKTESPPSVDPELEPVPRDGPSAPDRHPNGGH